MIVSPKLSSLAFEEKEQIFGDLEEDFTPELSLVVKVRNRSENGVPSDDPVKITGGFTISF